MPTGARTLALEQAAEEISAARDRLDQLLPGPVSELRSRVRQTGLPLFPEGEPAEHGLAAL